MESTHSAQRAHLIPRIPLHRPKAFQHTPLRHHPPRHQLQRLVQIPVNQPGVSRGYDVWVFAWAVIEQEVDGFGPVGLEEGEADGVRGDGGGAEALHACEDDVEMGMSKGEDVFTNRNS